MQDKIPIEYSPDRETGRFEYRRFLDYMLARNGLLGLVDDVNNTNPVVVAVTFDGGKISRFFSMLPVDLNKWIPDVRILGQGLCCSHAPVTKMFKVMFIASL
ncbi:MAG: hypothetical protein ACK51L_05025 [bacterium]